MRVSPFSEVRTPLRGQDKVSDAAGILIACPNPLSPVSSTSSFISSSFQDPGRACLSQSHHSTTRTQNSIPTTNFKQLVRDHESRFTIIKFAICNSFKNSFLYFSQNYDVLLVAARGAGLHFQVQCIKSMKASRNILFLIYIVLKLRMHIGLFLLCY